MKHFRKIWDKPKHDFLMEHKEMKIDDCYQLFLKTFPEASDVTPAAFRNERSRIGAISIKYKNGSKNHASRTPKPLFSEHEKKGYICVKVGQPNQWMFKQHYIWMINTGHKPEPKKEMVIFLDGNKRNFAFENLYLIPRNIAGILNNPKMKLGIIPENPELTKINIQNAILIHKIFDAGRKIGLVSESSGRFKEDCNKFQRERMQKIKQDPEKYAKYLEQKMKWRQNVHIR